MAAQPDQRAIEDYADCGLDGRATDPVHIGQFNKLMRRIALNHLSPLKTAGELMRSHVEECAKLQAKIAGGITVIIWLLGFVGSIALAVFVTLLRHWLP